MSRYVYSLLRFVPDPARGEFVNVGAVVGSEDTGEWDVRQVSSLRRARALDERGSLPAVTSVIESLTGIVTAYTEAVELGDEPGGEPEPSEEWLATLHRSFGHVVQVTSPTSVVCDSIDDAMSMVFEELIVEAEGSRRPFRPRTVASKELRSAYLATRRLRPRAHFFERVRLSSGPHEETLDFVVVNGSVLQLAQAWSFAVPEQRDIAQRVRAWGWTMRHLTQGGGRVMFDARTMQVGSDVDLEVVYVPPSSTYGTEAFDDASAVFAEIGATATPLDAAEGIAQRAVNLLDKAAATAG